MTSPTRSPPAQTGCVQRLSQRLSQRLLQPLSQFLSRQIYSVLMWALQPVLRRKLKRRGRAEAGYLHAIEERFGRYAHAPHAGGYVWVHAVSLGETRATAVLLQALRAAQPDIRILLTHGTATGRAQGARLLQDGDVQVWQPWDTPAAVQRFLTQFKPRLGILMETELWPNWVAQCQRAHVPLVLVNARMSPQSMAHAQRWSWLSRPAYQGLSAVFAQTEADAERLQALGAPVQGVLGNLKFDVQPDAAQLGLAKTWKQQLKRPVVLFASSREGEEVMWLDALQALENTRNEMSDSKLPHGAADMNPQHGAANPLHAVHWWVVPRHPQRFDEVAALIEQRGWQVSRRSAWTDGPAPDHTDDAPLIEEAPQIGLGDSLGEMALYYGLSDVALLGGSFAPLGGQNLIEATACGCPVIMGPHTFNFAQAAALAQAAGAALVVSDMAQAVTSAWRIANSEGLENTYAQACAAFTQAHRGAAQRTAQALLPYLMGR